MRHTRSRSNIRNLLGAFVLAALVVARPGDTAGGALRAPRFQGQTTREAAAVYIVQMLDPPVVAYDGGRDGLRATRPARGQHANPNSADVQHYRDFLNHQHTQALAAVGAPGDARFYDYNFSFNGFAATLTPGQVASLRQQPNVVAVSIDERRQPLTDNTPAFLGLSGPGRLWDQLGGQGAAGEDVVIGVIDTGIWPEHPSFSDQADLSFRPGQSGGANRVYGPPPSDWFGACISGERWSRNTCNNKLIGARWFVEGLTRHGVEADDYRSTRDHDGHGTHTASTAGGNAGVDPSIFGRDLGVGTISGMAPRARIAAYKSCFAEAGCVLSDLVAAIDTAVADGVDVINYSIGSTGSGAADAVSFLFAADAGVYVATSAGNAGPGAATIGSPASVPWVTTVGASTHTRQFEGAVTLGNGTTFTGGSVTPGVGPARLVDGGSTCVGGLNPATVAGAVVLCEGQIGIAHVQNSSAVAAAGGVGMILFDPAQPAVTPTDNHVVPTVHVTLTDGLTIEAYIASAGAGATATLAAGTAQPHPSAPIMAGFSSRGPNGAAFDIIKPDVTAPGVQILAGNSPTPFLGAQGELFQAIQGTSMSSAHVAGIGALLIQAHPDWSPAMIRSALMTTASQDVEKEDLVTPADPFDFGAGHIAPTPANDPGLVYDAGFADYIAFLCGAGQLTGGMCAALGSIDASDLNLPSIGVDGLAGSQTITRRVTNVGASATYAVAVDAPPGMNVAVAPASFTLAAGETATYEVNFTTTPTATLEEFAFGALTWSDGTHNVRSPIAVRPVALSFPGEVSGAGTDGSVSYEVGFGYTGTFNAAAHGLDAADVATDTVVDDPANDINVALSTGVGVNFHTITVAAGTSHLRASLFDENTDGEDDLDLYLFDPDGNFVDGSRTATSTEQVDAAAPVAGDWTVVVHGWQTDGTDATYDLFTWTLDFGNLGNISVTAPGTAALGGTGTITVMWSGLTNGTRYLGAVDYDDGVDLLGSTLVSVAF